MTNPLPPTDSPAGIADGEPWFYDGNEIYDANQTLLFTAYGPNASALCQIVVDAMKRNKQPRDGGWEAERLRTELDANICGNGGYDGI